MTCYDMAYDMARASGGIVAENMAVVRKSGPPASRPVLASSSYAYASSSFSDLSLPPIASRIAFTCGSSI